MRYGVAYWIEHDGTLWLVRRPAKGLLGGMVALPGPDWGAMPTADPKAAGIIHGFTHFELHLSVILGGTPKGDGWWQPIDRIGDAGLPTLYRRAVDAVLAQRLELAA